MSYEYILFALICTILLHVISMFLHERLSIGDHVTNEVVCMVLCFLLVVVVIVFCAFRKIGVDIGGTDAYGYQQQFLISTGSLIEQLKLFSGWEPLHAICLWLIRKYTSDYSLFLVATYLLMSCSLIKYAQLFDLNKNHLLSTFALLLLFIGSFNIQRNTFAVFMSIFIIEAIIKERYIKAVIIAIVLTGFHFSAALYFLIMGAFLFIKYFTGDKRNKLAGYLVVSSLAAVVISKLVPFIVGSSRLSIYQRGSNVSYAMILAFLIVVVFQKVFSEEIQKDKLLDALTILYISFMPMFIFQLYYSIMYRMMLYSIPILYALLAEYKKMLRTSKGYIYIPYMVLFDAILIIRIINFFTTEMVDIGEYVNVIFS